MRGIWAFFFCAFIAISNSAFAEKDLSSGNFMLEHCKRSVVEGSNHNVWDGWCAGAISVLLYVGPALPKYSSCPPSGVTNGQATRIVVRYLESHPEELHLDFRGLAAEALAIAWPCKPVR
jgi:hypothetical protein